MENKYRPSCPPRPLGRSLHTRKQTGRAVYSTLGRVTERTQRSNTVPQGRRSVIIAHHLSTVDLNGARSENLPKTLVHRQAKTTGAKTFPKYSRIKASFPKCNLLYTFDQITLVYPCHRIRWCRPTLITKLTVANSNMALDVIQDRDSRSKFDTRDRSAERAIAQQASLYYTLTESRVAP